MVKAGEAGSTAGKSIFVDVKVRTLPASIPLLKAGVFPVGTHEFGISTWQEKYPLVELLFTYVPRALGLYTGMIMDFKVKDRLFGTNINKIPAQNQLLPEEVINNILSPVVMI